MRNTRNVFAAFVILMVLGPPTGPISHASHLSKNSTSTKNPPHKTEGDLSPSMGEDLLKGIEYQEAASLFHQLNLAKESEPQRVVAGLIREGESLREQNCNESKSSISEIKFTPRMAVALGFRKTIKNSNSKTLLIRRKIPKLHCQILISSTLQSLHRLDEVLFNESSKLQN